jgi:hypothetical protein
MRTRRTIKRNQYPRPAASVSSMASGSRTRASRLIGERPVARHHRHPKAEPGRHRIASLSDEYLFISLLQLECRGTAILSPFHAGGGSSSAPRRIPMKRSAFAIAVAALALVAVSGASQAAPIAPLPTGVTASHEHPTQVQYWRHRWWWRHHPRWWWRRHHPRWWWRHRY